MGGNARVLDLNTGKPKIINGSVIGADKIDFSYINRQIFNSNFFDFLVTFNGAFFQKYKKHLWVNLTELFNSQKLFNGSSKYGFDKNISDEEFIKHKKFMGDIDIVIPKEELKNVFDFLKEIENKQITDNIKYLGQNKSEQSGEQINAIFEYSEESNKINFQLDFEGVIFNGDTPDEFSNFGHCSNWEDIKRGLKGVSHKFLIMNLVRSQTHIPSENAILLTPKSSIDPSDKKFKISKSEKYLKTHAFSIDKGLRRKLNKVGELNNLPLYKEISTAESFYEREINKIFQIIFNKLPTSDEIVEFYSFLGTVNLIKKYITNEDVIYSMFNFLLTENLFGPLAQKLDRFSMKVDFNIKINMIDFLFESFPFLKSKENKKKIELLVKEYYIPENYFNVSDKILNKNNNSNEEVMKENKKSSENLIRRIIQEEIENFLMEDSKLQKSLKKLLVIVKEVTGKTFEKQILKVYVSSDQSKWVEISLKSVNQTLSLNLLKDEISYGNTKIENIFKIKNTIPSKSWEEYSAKLEEFAKEISDILHVYGKLKKSSKIKEFINKEL